MRAAAFPVHDFVARFNQAACAIALCAATGASAPAYAWDWNLGLAKSVSGSGTIKSEFREVSRFTGISLSLNASVEIRQGGTEGVTIETDDNILPLMETAVENGTLKIRPAARSTSFTTRRLKFIVYAKTIDTLAIAGAGEIHAATLKAPALKSNITGSGEIRIESLDAGALSVNIAGSGDFAAAGRAASMEARITGSGDIQAGDLDARSVQVSIAGSGDATVWARETLGGKVAGSGDINYYGDAEVKKSIVGSGSIKRLGASPAGS